MTLTKAEKFRLLSSGIFESSTEGVSLASTTVAKADSQNSRTSLQNELDKPAAVWLADTPLGGEGSFAQETELLFSAGAGTKVCSTSLRPSYIKLGQPAPPELSFCPVQAVSKYPYKHIHNKALKDAVASSFFTGGKIFERSWNIFYIHPPPDISPKPLLLLPLAEVLSFFEVINKETHPTLKIPPRSDDCGFQVCFSEMDHTLRPRYLGKSACRDDFQRLENAVPPATFKPDGEILSPPPSERTLTAFKVITELAHEATKNKSKAAKARKQKERAEKQRGWGKQIKRTQRYLGLRLRAGVEQVSRQELEMGRPPLDVTSPAPYPMESSVVFASVDIESFERDHKRITEVGISVLDTKDLNGVPPGEGGSEWMKKIKTRHLRIRDNAHLRNKDFVMGCAEGFEFGTSEWVTLRDAPRVVAECFRFSPQDPLPRNIILLGHDVCGDIDYLKLLGYNPLNLSNLIEILDTSTMYRFLKREQNPRRLGAILADLDIMGWNLHNAGNDAAYTLQALLALTIKATTDKDTDWAEEQKRRVGEAAKEAVERAMELGEGWSSGGEGSDGGLPEKLPCVKNGGSPGKAGGNGDGGNGDGGNRGKNGNRNWREGGKRSEQRNGREDGPKIGQKNGREGGQWNGQNNWQQRGQKSHGSNNSTEGARRGGASLNLVDDSTSLL
ncbi:MAG: hypothetical protein M1840_003538 [Geoglossum simile]|nr:MAG: hypothetical protein M1840_003538 [Geoglossum simile]